MKVKELPSKMRRVGDCHYGCAIKWVDTIAVVVRQSNLMNYSDDRVVVMAVDGTLMSLNVDDQVAYYPKATLDLEPTDDK